MAHQLALDAVAGIPKLRHGCCLVCDVQLAGSRVDWSRAGQKCGRFCTVSKNIAGVDGAGDER
jgi:hypothetical protein